jgi:hypothetical protein
MRNAESNVAVCHSAMRGGRKRRRGRGWRSKERSILGGST